MHRAVGRAGTAGLPQPVPIWTSSRYRVRGCLRNPEIEAYRVRGFVQVLHARTAKRLRDRYLGCLLGVARPTARGVPRREIDDGPGEVPVLLRPRTHDPAGSPRLSKGRSPERSRVVDPVCPEQVPGPAGRGGGPPPREPAIPQRERRRSARGHRRDPGARAPPVHAERIPGAGDHHRVQVAVPRPDPRQAVQVHPDLQEPWRARGRIDLPSALATHWDDERTPFARILKDILGRMFGILDDPPFNYYIHTAPCDRKETKYHWHLEITPRLTETAGFERGTGFYINPVMPEDAAGILRERVKLSDKTH